MSQTLPVWAAAKLGEPLQGCARKQSTGLLAGQQTEATQAAAYRKARQSLL